jgi:gluconolactonase
MFGFPPPSVIRSEIFAQLPERYRSPGHGPRSPLRHSGAGTTLEGPSFDRLGNLYITDLANSRIFRISPSGDCTFVAEYDGEPNGLKIHKDGRIFVADHRHGLMQLDPASGTMSLLCGGPEKERFKGINDLVVASNGDLYLTDQGGTGLHDPTGRVYRLRENGELTCLIDTVPSPNGIVLDSSERVLYVAVTRANQVWNVPLTLSGGLTKVGVFVQLPCPAPDGLAMDLAENLAVAAPGLGLVWVFDRFGLPIYRVEMPGGRHVTNLAYGGPDNRFLYMTEGDTYAVLRAEMPAAGRPMFSHQ